MKKVKLMLLTFLVATLVLETLPYGAVLNFANPEGEPFRHTYSYFDLTPFGYAMFAPLITAIITCIALITAILFVFIERKITYNMVLLFSASALVCSIFPFFYGITYITVIGVMISICLMSNCIIMILMRKKMIHNEK